MIEGLTPLWILTGILLTIAFGHHIAIGILVRKNSELEEKLGENMATLNDLVWKIGELKPLVEAKVAAHNSAVDAIHTANAQVDELNSKVASEALDQKDLDSAVAMVDELKSLLS